MKMRVLAIAVTALTITGCASTNTSPAIPKIPEPTYTDAINNRFIDTNQYAAEKLVKKLGNKIGPNSAVIISTIANINDLSKTSTLGRIVSEQVSARFSESGYNMVELKLGGSVYISEGRGGEFVLTRDVQELASTHNAPAVIVGSYAASQRFVYINLKVVQPGTNTVLATHDYALPLDSDNRRLLHGNLQ